MSDELEKPCYVISSNGYKLSVSYEDDWCYGKSEYIGTTPDHSDARRMIKAHIRLRYDERNRLPLYMVSDHGNVQQVRRISLRNRRG